MNDSKFSLDDLEGRTYRDLQQLAKSLGLPSNVKKVYLIQLIHAKKYKSKEEVDIIVQNVKLERKQFSKIRKNTARRRAMQRSEILSSSDTMSPPISNTPKRPDHFVIHCSPNIHQTIMKFPRASLLRPNYVKKTYPPMKAVDSSDRVLRSFNIKSQVSQANLNGNILKVIKSQNSINMRPAITQRHTSISQETRVNLDNQERHYNQGLVDTKCVGTQHSGYNPKPQLNIIKKLPRVQLVTAQNNVNSKPTLVPRQQRRLSGVYPIVVKNQPPKVNYDYIKSIGYRRSDGKISKINALVQKRNDGKNSFRNIDVTVQDLINSNIDSQAMNSECNMQESMPNLQYPNTTGLECLPSCSQRQFNYFDMSNETLKENECSQSSVYFHKKIRSEQIRSQKNVQHDVRFLDEEVLPRIDEVFSRFNSVNNRDVTQPIYVQVSEESERILNYPISKSSNTNMLETLYNFKSQFLISQPVLKIATTAITKCVYSTPVIATPMAQISTATNDACYVTTCERDSQCSNETIPRIYDFLAMTEQDFATNRCYNDSVEGISTSTSSLDRSGLQQASIPDMVEDALEIISQDGDYMERIGMDVRMQCILCSWAGPRIILEYHVRKDHQNQIYKQERSDWNVVFSLGSLLQPLWVSRVAEYRNDTYVLSAKYEPGYFMATLTTSRVLNSTFRYVNFVKKLRALEEEEKKGRDNNLKELKDKQLSDFFISCDRRSLINNVARRVDLCLQSYEEDLKEKKKRLTAMLSQEEEANTRKVVEQAQAGAEAIWQDKKDRLAYLLAKRQKEHEERYKDTPLSKCVHVLPCIYKLRAKEAEEIQLYQMKEKQAMKMAEKEFDKMWYAVAMKEAEALTARLEQEAMERLRRDQECKQYTDYQLEQRQLQREKEREMLKQETIRFRAIWDADNKKEEEAERQRTEKRLETARERKKMIEERQEVLAKQQAADRLISDTWDSLAGQGLADEKRKVELMRKKERELDECNRKMIELKQEMARLETADDALFEQDAAKRQEMVDQRRCQYLTWSQKTNKEVRQAMIDQIKDRQNAREALKKKLAEQDEYHRQLFSQLQQLVDHKQLTDAQSRKQHQNNLVQQIEYNKMLKEKARQEELDQIKKAQIATQEYEKEIARMLSRPFFSDEVHPFMKQMAKGLETPEKCPCSRPDYCK